MVLTNYLVSAGKIPSPTPFEEKVKEDLDVEDPEEDSKHFIAIIIQCLSLLDKIPESINVSCLK